MSIRLPHLSRYLLWLYQVVFEWQVPALESAGQSLIPPADAYDLRDPPGYADPQPQQRLNKGGLNSLNPDSNIIPAACGVTPLTKGGRGDFQAEAPASTPIHPNPSNTLDLILLEDTIWLLVGEVNPPNNDFAWHERLAGRRPWPRNEVVNAIARLGMIPNYDQTYQTLLDEGIRLIHSPEQHRLASDVSQWSPLLADLTSVPSEPSAKRSPALTLRTFWWRGQCVGAGQYEPTSQTPTPHDWRPEAEQAAFAIAQTAATRLNLPFVAIDVAQTATGNWSVIQCNDAQEVGYGAISPFTLWQNLVHAEQQVCQVLRE